MAPELFYDDENDRFVIIWASTIPFKFAKGEEDERNNHRMYYVTTKDFRTFSKAALFLDPGFQRHRLRDRETEEMTIFWY